MPSKSHKDNAYDKITNQFVEAIKEAIKDPSKNPSWVRPWSKLGGPRNAFSNRPYQGFNALILGMLAGLRGWDDLRYSTFNAIKKNGGKVKKGEKGTHVTLWKFIPDPKDDTKKIPLLRTFVVFNVKHQTEGIELKEIEAPNKDERDAQLDHYIAGLDSLNLEHGGDRAFYSPMGDYVGMPHFEYFNSGDAYYSTLFHELTHWTGHDSRLKRPLLEGRFGNEAYAFEELVAELGNAFLCQALGVDGEFQENHVAYLKSWLKVLENDHRAIITASSKAKSATKFLLRGMGVEEETFEDEEEEVAA